MTIDSEEVQVKLRCLSVVGTQYVLIAGHFTQLVWKGTKSMGIAMVKGKSGRIVIVAYYNPPGNIMGQFMDNVLKPC